MTNLFSLFKTFTSYYIALASTYIQRLFKPDVESIFNKKQAPIKLPSEESVKLFMEECDSHIDLKSYVSSERFNLRHSGQDRRRPSMFSLRKTSVESGYVLPPPIKVSDSSDALHSSNESGSSESSSKGDSSESDETFVLPPSVVNFEMNDQYVCDNCDMDSDSKQICEIVRDGRRKTLSPEMFLADLAKLKESLSLNNMNTPTELEERL